MTTTGLPTCRVIRLAVDAFLFYTGRASDNYWSHTCRVTRRAVDAFLFYTDRVLVYLMEELTG